MRTRFVPIRTTLVRAALLLAAGCWLLATASAQIQTVNIKQVNGTNVTSPLPVTCSNCSGGGVAGGDVNIASYAGAAVSALNPFFVTPGTGATWAVTGTFWQATQPISIADGSSATLGAKADAKSTSTDTTAISIVSILKEISFMEQNPASRAVTGTFFQATQPVSIASMPSTPVTGTFFQATQPVSIASMPSTPVTGTFWQATQPVSIASMPSTPVTGTFFQATQPVSGTVTANAGSGTFTNQQSNITADYDTGAGTQTLTMFGVALPASGGAVAGGTSSNPLQVSLANTGANATAVKVDGSAVTQPVSGTFFQATQPVSIASMPSTPVTGTFWQATQPVSGTFFQATQPVSIADGSSTTLGAKADAKSTATDSTAVTAMQVLKEISAMEQAPASRAVTNAGTFAVQNTQQGTASQNVAQINAVTPLMGNGVTGTGSQRVTIASDNTAFAVNNTQQGTASQNVAQINAVTPLMGNGVTGTGSQRVTIASDNTAFAVNNTQQGTASQNVAQINAVTPLMGNGVTGTGSQRVTIASDNTAFAVNNTQQGTASQNVAQINAVTPLMGNGVTGTGSQRVTIASDNTAFAVNNTQQGTASQNVAQVNGAATVTSVTGVQNVMPVKRTASTGLAPNYSASHITTKTTTTIISATAYISACAISVTGAGTSQTLLIQNKEATPKVLYTAGAAIVVGNNYLNFAEPILMTSGIDIVTGGTTAGTQDVFCTYWQ